MKVGLALQGKNVDGRCLRTGYDDNIWI